MLTNFAIVTVYEYPFNQNKLFNAYRQADWRNVLFKLVYKNNLLMGLVTHQVTVSLLSIACRSMSK
jgi:hypothetical protein